MSAANGTEALQRDSAYSGAAEQLPEGHSLVVTSRDCGHHDLVRQFHERHIATTFAAHEVEDMDVWIERLEDQNSRGTEVVAVGGAADATDFEFSLALIVRDCDSVVVAGAAHEVYFKSRCGLVSYLVVDESLRGKGIGALLMDVAYENCESILRRHGSDEPFEALFIEVLQARDDHPEEEEELKGGHGNEQDGANKRSAGFRSVARQKIFRRMGFQPLDLDFVHPGKMKGHGHRYNIALRSKLHPVATTGRFPARVALQFLEGLVMGILADEDSTDRAEMKQWHDLLEHQEYVAAGDAYWR